MNLRYKKEGTALKCEVDFHLSESFLSPCQAQRQLSIISDQKERKIADIKIAVWCNKKLSITISSVVQILCQIDINFKIKNYAVVSNPITLQVLSLV